MTIHAISVLCVPHVESTPQKTQDGDEPDCAHGEVFLDDDDDDDDDGIHDDDDDDGDDDVMMMKTTTATTTMTHHGRSD